MKNGILLGNIDDTETFENVQIAYISSNDNFSFQYVNNETERTVFPG